ncbi:MAG TPA: glycosyltransferase family 1 protein [Cyclobacteriaceae bacterium]|nr:glycosyltransferase family 1 protein [Cyclobacteriaceae bacterium]
MPSTNRAKIIFDGSPLRYLHTGLGQVAYYLINEYARHPGDFDFSFLVHRVSKKYIPEFTEQCVEISPLRKHAPQALLPLLFERYDVWHASAENTKFTNFPKSARVLLTVHGLHFLDEDPPEIATEKLKHVQNLVNKSHALATDSKYSEDLIRKHIALAGRPLKTIHLGVSEDKRKEFKKPALLPQLKYLFSVGSFFERKNFHVLLPMLQRMEGYALVLSGEHRRGYGEFIKKEISRLALSDRVILTGEIDEAEKNWWYANCEAFVFPSVSEGFGIPVLEAMQFGKPVFCSLFGSLPEIGGDCAFYWNSFEPELMRDLFLEKMNTFNQTPAMKDNNRLRASSFAWSKTARGYLDYYAELLQ